MSETLSTSSSVGITLSVNGADTSPFTIAPTGTVSTTGGYGIYSAVAAPSLLTAGYIAAAGGIGVQFKQYGTIVNNGTITAPQNNYFYGATGVSLKSGGYIANAGPAAVITGGFAIRINGQATITNAGTIEGLGNFSYGVQILDAGTSTRITNSAGGVITGHRGAVRVQGTADIVNQGLIITYKDSYIALSYPAIFLSSGTIDNAKGGTIIGVELGSGLIINAGLISDTLAAGYAIELGANANVSLQTGATVIGGIYGFIAGETIDEAGLTITSESAVLTTTAEGFLGSVLTLFDQNSILGTLEFAGALNTSAFSLVSDGNGGTDIVLGTETFTGSYTNTNSRRGTNIASVHLAALTNVVAPGASIVNSFNHVYAIYGSTARDWSLTNYGTINGGAWFANNGFVSNVTSGLIEGNVGVKIAAGTLVDSGTIIGADAAIDLLPGSSGVDIVLNPGAVLEGGIYGFVAGDTIDMAGVFATNETFSGGVLTLTNAGVEVATVGFDGIFDSSGFQLESIAGGTGIIIAPTETIAGQFAAGATKGLFSSPSLINFYDFAAVRLSSPFTSIASNASISGGRYGIVGKGPQSRTLVNSGTIIAGIQSIGVSLSNGQVINSTGGLINGYDIGVVVAGTSLINTGSISGAVGVYQSETGAISDNLASGNISGSRMGANINGGSFANEGTVSGEVGIKLTAATFINTGRVIGAGGAFYSAGGDIGLHLYIPASSGNGIGSYASNAAGGIVEGTAIGVQVDAGILDNAGTILGLSTYAIVYGTRSTLAGTGVALSGGTVTNTSSGIFSGDLGVALNGGTLVNAGTIASTIAGTGVAVAFGAPNATLVLDAGNVIDGAIANFHGGDMIDFAATTITGDSFANGILTLADGGTIVETLSLTGFINQQDLTLVSQGTAGTALIIGQDFISGSYGTGISLTAPTTITQTGTINSGAATAVDANLPLVNDGVVISTQIAVLVEAGGMVTNATGGQIDGGSYGILAHTFNNAPVLIVNAGTIQGTGGFGDFAIHLFEDATVINSGLVQGATGIGAAAFSTITNTGTIIGSSVGVMIEGATLVDAGTIIGTAGPAISLAAGNGGNDVVIDPGALLEGGIYGFAAGDTIEFAGVIATGETFGGGILTLTNAGAVVATVGLDGVFASNGLILETLSGGTGIITAPTETITGRYAAQLNLTAQFTSIAANGSIGGTPDGVVGQASEAWTLINSGTISGEYNGVTLASGQITNSADGLIKSQAVGVSLQGTSLTNDGSVQGALEGIVLFDAGAVASNLAAGSIYGQQSGALMYGGSLFNAGTIQGPYGARVDDGVFVNAGTVLGLSSSNTGRYGNLYKINGTALDLAGGVVTNTSKGNISGAYGVALNGGTLINAGTVEGSIDAIDFGGTGENRLIVDAGAVFLGTVVASSAAINTLEFAAETSAATGTLSGIGSQFTGIQNIMFDLGGTWSAEGDMSGLASGQTISGFAAGDTINLDGFTAASFSYVSGAGLKISDGVTTETLDISGNFNTSSFSVTRVMQGTQILLQSNMPCFAAGTRLLGWRGEIAVEDVRVGDRLVTVRDGGPTDRPVIWTGRRHVVVARHANPSEVRPIRICAGALAAGVPERDLLVSPHHALYLDRLLFEAASLVNGRTIFADFNIHEITYHHVELDAHDIVLAEGCAAESYLDTGTKQDFEGEVTALHPVFTAAGGKTCVPLILTGEALRVARLGIEAAVPAGIQGTERMRVTFGGTSAIG